MFDELIEEVDSQEFQQVLKGFGYGGLLMQVGNCKYLPINSTLLDQETGAPVDENDSASAGKIVSYYYRFKRSLAEDMQNSALIISHGGSGSILEALQFHKPIVCVTNSRLMHNHQVELAERLSTSPYNYLLPCDPSTLQTVIKQDLKGYLTNRQELDEHVVVKSLADFGKRFQQEVSFTRHHSNKKDDDDRPTTRPKSNKTMVVLGSGGHTAEMFYLLKHIHGDYNRLSYVLADSDKRSYDKIVEFEQTSAASSYSVHQIPRSRNVGQSYFFSIFTTIYAFFYCLLLVFRDKPDIVICNGPGTCVPIVIAAVLFRFLRIHACKIVYIESIARVQHLSLSGKILQYVANWMIVQWPSLIPEYNDSKSNNKPSSSSLKK
ncbi:putative glycosyltransferase [Cavenderia fasciculata]|uniref:UDP-N-acetylglucosamine transferase subunit ALG14 n=1 Tax=Cavenderia fasciculata TaxID=261658 RepID=F4Q0H2_CACFS|nr:putative glycosyltransferase [Cavenderia fasciculata]EGG18323.1 putative glycosyltransferase [Cavenderia fasciculata]|eukprot:XP_004366227.1 putative glycosyltransferase [Cavenderia fasciculata]